MPPALGQNPWLWSAWETSLTGLPVTLEAGGEKAPCGSGRGLVMAQARLWDKLGRMCEHLCGSG